MLSALLLSLSLHPSGNVAQKFVQNLTSGEIREFIPIATNANGLTGDGWFSVRDLFARYDCISIRTYRVSEDGDHMIIDVDGEGVTRNARHERRAIPSRWFLRLSDRTIADAKDEREAAVDDLLAARNDEERGAVATRSVAILSSVARRIADLSVRTDGERTSEAALYLAGSDDRATQTYAFAALARRAIARGDYPLADRLADQGRGISHNLESCDPTAYLDVVTIHKNTTELVAAQALDRAIASVESLDDPFAGLRALYLRAGYEFARADFSTAHRTLHALLKLSLRYGSREGELYAHHGDSMLYGGIDDHEGERSAAMQTFTIAHQQMDAMVEARASNIIGESLIYNRLDPEYPKAIEWLNRAIEAAPPTSVNLSIFHTNLGDALVRSGHVAEAERHLEPALAHAREAQFLPRALLFGEHLRRAQGRHGEAIAFARQGIAEAGESPFVAWELRADLGELLVESGQVDDGIASLRKAIEQIETRRSASTSNGLIRAHHFATRLWVYSSLVDILVDHQRYDEALEVAENMKARTLDDLLTGDRSTIVLTEAQRDQERDLNRRIADLNTRLRTARGNDIAQIHQSLRMAHAEAKRFAVDTALQGSQLAAPSALPESPSKSGRSTAVLEYAVLPRTIVAFVTLGGKVTGTRISVQREDLEQRVQRLSDLIAQRDLRYEKEARGLYDLLFRPIEPVLAREKNIIIVPDAFLWNIPFDVLLTPGGQFLIERHSISYAPSTTMLDAAASRVRKRRPTAHQLLALGDPIVNAATRDKASLNRDLSLGALPDAAREVQALAKLYGATNATVLTGASARESVFKTLAHDYRVLHLATHGIVDDDSPLYSALVLARADNDVDDGMLETREIRQLTLNADLAILSACNTARGTLYPGEGIIGLSWAFLAAGCPTTVVSQWEADSQVTSRLMIAFHRHLLAGDTTSEALRKAKLSLMRDKEHRHPFYWATFIAVGS